MNATAIKGLFLDALYQVLDNKVFRVLLVLTVIPILATFLIGLGEESFQFVFGLWEADYPDFVSMLGEDPRAVMIEAALGFFVDGFVGSMGITVCIAATAFFVPRMLEKGAADLVFVKPLPRWTLYLSRYITGLFFVGILSVFLTFGMYLGVLVASGTSYTGILWSSLTLIYLFSLIHGVTMLIGLVTRSTPAAMILGIIFFFGNGCVHTTWQLIDQARYEQSPEAAMMGLAVASTEQGDETGTWDNILSVGAKAVDVMHYALPKTSDAPLVVLHTQEALLPSGRLEAQEALIETLSGQNPELEERREKRRAERLAEQGLTTVEEDAPIQVTIGGSGKSDSSESASRDTSQDGSSEAWFARNFGYGAEEWRYSTWFSLLSSLGFTVFILLFGVWRLNRMDF